MLMLHFWVPLVLMLVAVETNPIGSVHEDLASIVVVVAAAAGKKLFLIAAGFVGSVGFPDFSF